MCENKKPVFIDNESNESVEFPFYIRVAQWVLEQGVAVNRHHISNHFRVPLRRAAELMMYIDGPGRRLIDAERYILRDDARREVAWLRVTAVYSEKFEYKRTCKPRGSVRGQGLLPDNSLSSLRDLALGRYPMSDELRTTCASVTSEVQLCASVDEDMVVLTLTPDLTLLPPKVDRLGHAHLAYEAAGLERSGCWDSAAAFWEAASRQTEGVNHAWCQARMAWCLRRTRDVLATAEQMLPLARMGAA